jgi:PEP-CTERM motif
MKWFSKAAVGGLLWLTFSSAAFGTTLFLTGYTEDVDDGGQFLANLGNPAQSFYVYCIDFQNEETSPATVNISTPNTSTADVGPNYDGLANTRYGAVPTSAFTYANSGPNALNSAQRYVMAAWLVTQYNFPGSNVTLSDDEIQNAIWTLLNTTGTTSGFPFGDALGTGTFLTQAYSYVTTTPTAALLAFESEIQIFTSTNVVKYNGPNWSPLSGTQEMITVNTASTPEPATLAMMGAGLLTLGMFRKRMKA